MFMDTQKMSKYTMPCGCEFDILEKNGNSLKLDIPLVYRNINYFCPLTWELLQAGLTKGVFQLETGFAQSFSEKLKPENLEHLSALGAILRPGPLKSGMAELYIKRKNGEEPNKPFDESLEKIMDSTYHCLCYQEQSMAIAMHIAGMDESTTDKLIRKGLAKKKADLIEKAKELFISGAEQKGLVTKEQAENIFAWIEKGSRYLFNKCLSPNTVVELEDGSFLCLDEIAVGDKIKCHNGYSSVKEIFDQGEHEVFRVTLESGKEIECTINHKFLCEDGKIRPLIDIIYESHKIMSEKD